jgi:hypothetical protein
MDLGFAAKDFVLLAIFLLKIALCLLHVGTQRTHSISGTLRHAGAASSENIKMLGEKYTNAVAMHARTFWTFKAYQYALSKCNEGTCCSMVRAPVCNP